MDKLLKRAVNGWFSLNPLQAIEERGNIVVAHFLFSIVWSIGACLEKQHRDRLVLNEFFSL